MFFSKYFAENRRVRERCHQLELELAWVKMRLECYDKLFWDLRRYDHFRFNSGGGIVAYKENEANQYGTGFCVPEEVVKIEFYTA